MSTLPFSVGPNFGKDRTGALAGYVILCVPGTGAALSIEQSRELRAQLEQAEEALLAARAMSADDQALLGTAAGGRA